MSLVDVRSRKQPSSSCSTFREYCLVKPQVFLIALHFIKAFDRQPLNICRPGVLLAINWLTFILLTICQQNCQPFRLTIYLSAIWLTFFYCVCLSNDASMERVTAAAAAAAKDGIMDAIAPLVVRSAVNLGVVAATSHTTKGRGTGGVGTDRPTHCWQIRN